MRVPPVAGRPIKVILLAALLAMAACTNANNSVSSASSVSMPVASAENGSSINKVSDALGQRLDGMLNSQHMAGH
jgi:hypothetical protein